MSGIKQSDVGRIVHVKGKDFDWKNCILLRFSLDGNHSIFVVKEREMKIVKSEEIVEMGDYIDAFRYVI